MIESNVEDATDYETSSLDCLFNDDNTLPKAITLCLRDTFVKRDVDH